MTSEYYRVADAPQTNPYDPVFDGYGECEPEEPEQEEGEE